jgi:hypothetical protein
MRPVFFFVALAGLSALAYVPLILSVGPFAWSSWGPFQFQTGRILHYLVYFMGGAAAGVLGRERRAFAADGRLARGWWFWILAAAAAYWGLNQLFDRAMAHHGVWDTLCSIGFSVSCAATSFAFLAVFARVAGRPSRLLDHLRANAYGVYLLHYAAVSWCLYTMTFVPLPALAKLAIVLVAAVGISWGASAQLRKIRAVARVV